MMDERCEVRTTEALPQHARSTADEESTQPHPRSLLCLVISRPSRDAEAMCEPSYPSHLGALLHFSSGPTQVVRPSISLWQTPPCSRNSHITAALIKLDGETKVGYKSSECGRLTARGRDVKRSRHAQGALPLTPNGTSPPSSCKCQGSAPST